MGLNDDASGFGTRLARREDTLAAMALHVIADVLPEVEFAAAGLPELGEMRPTCREALDGIALQLSVVVGELRELADAVAAARENGPTIAVEILVIRAVHRCRDAERLVIRAIDLVKHER